jgi:hypothetical protein
MLRRRPAPSVRIPVRIELCPNQIVIAHFRRHVLHDAPPSREILDRGRRQDDPVVNAVGGRDGGIRIVAYDPDMLGSPNGDWVGFSEIGTISVQIAHEDGVGLTFIGGLACELVSSLTA